MSTPPEAAVKDDLASARFRAGIVRKQWRVVSFVFPMLIVSVAAVEPDGKASEYAFQFELTGFPGTPPEAFIWDTKTSARLAVAERPQDRPGSLRRSTTGVRTAITARGNDRRGRTTTTRASFPTSPGIRSAI